MIRVPVAADTEVRLHPGRLHPPMLPAEVKKGHEDPIGVKMFLGSIGEGGGRTGTPD